MAGWVCGATPDARFALVEIYAPYVRKTAVTFEYDVPSVAAFSGRIERVLEKFPYLVAENDGEIVGYAYAGAFHPRAAYQWCAEMSVYVKRAAHGRGTDALRRDGSDSAHAAAHQRGGLHCCAECAGRAPDHGQRSFSREDGLSHGRHVPSVRL